MPTQFCSALFFYRHDPPEQFQRTRENCLAAARAVEAKHVKYQAYCVGDDRAVLNASGRVIDEREYYEDLDRRYEARKGK